MKFGVFPFVIRVSNEFRDFGVVFRLLYVFSWIWDSFALIITDVLEFWSKITLVFL